MADSNVWVAAAINPNGVCGQLVRAALDGRWQAVASPYLLDEIAEVLRRDKFRRWLALAEVELFIAGLAVVCDVQPDPEPPSAPLTVNPDDDYLITLALATEVDFLVSGDSDLTQLSNPRPPILTPTQFLGYLQ